MTVNAMDARQRSLRLSRCLRFTKLDRSRDPCHDGGNEWCVLQGTATVDTFMNQKKWVFVCSLFFLTRTSFMFSKKPFCWTLDYRERENACRSKKIRPELKFDEECLVVDRRTSQRYLVGYLPTDSQIVFHVRWFERLSQGIKYHTKQKAQNETFF
jgi:hypothetical protein